MKRVVLALVLLAGLSQAQTNVYPWAVGAVMMREQFCSGSDATSLQIGELGWFLSSSGFVSTLAGPTAGAPCGIAVLTGASSGQVTTIAPSGTVAKLTSTETFDIRLKVVSVTGTSPSSNITLRFGIFNAVSGTVDPPTDGFYLEKLAADTNWWCNVRNASVDNRTDTGVAYTTSAFALEVRRIDATHIGCKVAATLTILARASEISNAATESTFNMSPVVLVKNTAAEAKILNVSYFDMAITGLNQ